ncbi:MAG: hypothetical protein F6K04_00025 [Leptolyngbya sp. SIO4C5]|uniref:hypothetical protein n=1 Tax=Sphaerothrix gracilis TaxID=3151835 RepID=UPI0013C1D677|nr:hypothetical protein [Leptolyngbya sp. SIO4C5]
MTTETPVEKRRDQMIRMRPSLKKKAQIEAVYRECKLSDIIEDALNLYFAQKERSETSS